MTIRTGDRAAMSNRSPSPVTRTSAPPATASARILDRPGIGVDVDIAVAGVGKLLECGADEAGAIGSAGRDKKRNQHEQPAHPAILEGNRAPRQSRSKRSKTDGFKAMR